MKLSKRLLSKIPDTVQTLSGWFSQRSLTLLHQRLRKGLCRRYLFSSSAFKKKGIFRHPISDYFLPFKMNFNLWSWNISSFDMLDRIDVDIFSINHFFTSSALNASRLIFADVINEFKVSLSITESIFITKVELF